MEVTQVCLVNAVDFGLDKHKLKLRDRDYTV